MIKNFTMKYNHNKDGSKHVKHEWANVISKAYFPLDVETDCTSKFNSALQSWSLGVVDLSILESSSVLYRRHKQHLLDEQDSSLLITLPQLNEVNFRQSSRDIKCRPGEFLIERGDAPYEFWHGKKNKLCIIKVSAASIRSRIGPTERLGGLYLDATTGVASYLWGAVRNTLDSIDIINDVALSMAGQHILDMICLSILNDDRVLDSANSSIRSAHLQRAEQFIRDNLLNPNLSPTLVADACGISLRYLQRLFAENNNSILKYIRNQRLDRCHEELKMTCNKETLASISYRWFFYDQAQFCKHYRNRFGCTPTETRKLNRKNLILDE